jgi:hypothetical protein
MKHAGSEALDQLEPVLARLRRLEGLRERKRGTFYRGSSAFLHFHEDPAGMFADLKVAGEFVRMRVNDGREADVLVARAERALKDRR